MQCDFIAPIHITEDLCKRFRQFPLGKFTGDAPGNYYARFKWAVSAAGSDGYFQKNPTEKDAVKCGSDHQGSE